MAKCSRALVVKGADDLVVKKTDCFDRRVSYGIQNGTGARPAVCSRRYNSEIEKRLC